ncbi:unnamed protein product [Ceratitis capitata]|uniref:(Mediterranean fruit fly) hypothetical protein n=1 Tax=Ceratitis capitata TaxID=7213 RepID=A0A811USS3_CERCA|nr:unnamed protein product [Ceratitis capitata]
MAVVFYMPEGGGDDTASSSSGGHSSTGSGSAASSTSQSPNTTTSATQTPMQSPLVPNPYMVALCEALLYQSMNIAVAHSICYIGYIKERFRVLKFTPHSDGNFEMVHKIVVGGLLLYLLHRKTTIKNELVDPRPPFW